MAAYEKAVGLKPDLKEAWFNMALALKEEGRIAEADRAFSHVRAGLRGLAPLRAHVQGGHAPACFVKGVLEEGCVGCAGGVTLCTTVCVQRLEDKPVPGLHWRVMGADCSAITSTRHGSQVLALDEPGSPNVHALRVMAQMRQQKGDHAGAVEILDKAIGYGKEDQVGGDGWRL